jgi:hypothetical protein
MSEYALPDREFVDVTPELIAKILEDLPPHGEGDIAFTIKTDDLARLLEATGATVLRGYRHATKEEEA